MKLFTLNRASIAIALLSASASSFAQSPANPITFPTVPSLPAGSLDLANLAAQQAQMVSDIITKVHEQTEAATRGLLGAAAEAMDPDELEAALAERIPGFAGIVHREDGTSVMRLAGIKSSDAATALSRLPSAAAFAASVGTKVQVQAATWDSRQLLGFKQKAFGLASAKGVVATWINRETNRVEVHYNADLDPSAIEALTNQLVGTGIPRAAIVLNPGEIATTTAATGVSLQSQTLPLAGGSQIVLTIGAGKELKACTLTVPAIRSGVRGFVTGSHCSTNAFGAEVPSQYGDSTNVTYIADEKVDPKGGACPSALKGADRGCRKADALFAAARVSNAVDLGHILMTPGAKNLTASKILNVVGTQSNPTVNQTVYKTGRTTGTTSAKVARVCVDRLISDLNGAIYGLQCSSEVDSAGFVAPGDSGAPVYLSSNGAIITGIVSYQTNSGSTRGFSPWGAVVKELGSLTIK